jgi:DNA-binding LacI/PurR family transcriptional regulator
MATGALRAIREAGLQVPGDLAVVGFDGTQLSAFTDPPLTTVRQPIYDSGRQVAEMLLAAVSEPEAEGRWELIHPTLVVRRSSGGAPSN